MLKEHENSTLLWAGLLVLWVSIVVAGCAIGDLVLIKITRPEGQPQTVMEVKSDGDTTSDPSVSQRQEDVPGDDRGRDPGAFMELWPD